MRGDILAVSIELNLNRLAHHVGIEIESVSVIFDAASSCNRHAAKRHGYILINKFFGTVESNGDFFTLIAGRSLVEVIVQTDLAFERNRYVVNENGRIDFVAADCLFCGSRVSRLVVHAVADDNNVLRSVSSLSAGGVGGG